MINEKEVEEILGKQSETGLEANMSSTVRGYYKGYSVLLTMRDPSVEAAPLLEKSMAAIDWMEEQGFKPSWADDSSSQPKSSPKGGFDKTKQDNCDHDEGLVVKEAGLQSKNPGRKYEACKKCGKWVRWADYK